MGVPKLARMSFSATLTMVMSIIAISAAVITTAVMPTFEPETCSVSMVTLLHNSRGLLVDTCGLLGADGDFGAQPGPQLEARRVVQTDQYRHTLHDLGE